MTAIRDLVDLMLHRWIWSGDKIRLYSRNFKITQGGGIAPDDTFLGEFFVKVEGGAVRVPEHHPYSVIRRDLPKWNNQLECWEYHYVDGHGS